MKTLNYFILVAGALTTMFFTTTSCSKKSTPTPTPAPVSPAPTYTFNAFGVTATGVQYTISNPNTGPLQITGSNGNGTNSSDQTVVITINSAVNSVGSYTLSSSNNNTGVYTTGSNTIRYATNSSPYVGTLTISKIDMTNRVMSASFNFNAQQTMPNTSGSGNIYGSFSNISF